MVLTLKWASLSPVSVLMLVLELVLLLHWNSSSSRQQLPLSVATAAAVAAAVVVEVTFNAIIYEFIFFAPPNRTLNAVWPDQARTEPNRTEQIERRREQDTRQTQRRADNPDRGQTGLMPGLYAHSLDAACAFGFRICKQTGQTNQTVRIFYGAANPIPSRSRSRRRHRSRIGNGIAIAIGIAMAIGMGIAIAIAIAIRFLAICSISLLCRRRRCRCRRSFNVGQLKLELSVVRHVLHFMSYGATMVLHCHSISI